MVTCAGCGAANDEWQRFCGQCGAGLGRACATCGEVANSSSSRFCGRCGATLDAPVEAAVTADVAAAIAERRVCSVLFVDLVGFTPLSEARDPEEVRELLSRYFDV